ncbi:MAG: cobalamin-independent methionine synthase II family protein [Eubacteriales bacterium]|uniref:cobalamin-independent methionine synthase II family protein n=1 Tax=Fenollaria sp. TaxID=1965292 RepID=UPI002A74BFE1|nr:cobalamin-independent methionine synthase II family protein [Fenollaria sp.]MDD7340111.1 cobalamin-independent methionine synthase II family protein [Eubacteriales bacterium]MDY3105921.1 cobalamin-independent methionine synthase II family protein [Fenollaria sp.]
MTRAFSTSLIGSMPRNEDILRALRKRSKGSLSEEDFIKLIDAEEEAVVRMQEKHGISYVTSGELSRDNYVSFISTKLNGVKMMSMSEMLEYIDDKKAFEQILSILDVPAISIKNAICTGKVSRKTNIVCDELKRLKARTDHKVKITLPGPYLVTRSMWLYNLSSKAYGSKEELGEDVIKIYKEEIEELQKIGVDIIQFDEPVLTEVVFTEGKPRTFMCAALSEKKDPTEELKFATHLIKSCMEHIDRTKSMRALHVCRGNWSKDESILLEGPYTPLIKLFEDIDTDALFLEFSTKRAGELKSLFASDKIRENYILGLGVINPRTDEIESHEDMVARAEEALGYIDKERLFLNPDCGFATFANRPVSTLEIIDKKLEELETAVKELKEKHE